MMVLYDAPTIRLSRRRDENGANECVVIRATIPTLPETEMDLFGTVDWVVGQFEIRR